MQDCVTAATFATHLKSVNDVSDRSVKLIEDCHECVANDKETRQQLLQVVERSGTGGLCSPKRRSQEVPDTSKE